MRKTFLIIHNKQGFIKQYRCSTKKDADIECRAVEQEYKQPMYSVRSQEVQNDQIK